MGDRRMFHSAVVGSDAFMDLPAGVQALYFHLGMQADDDGFVNNPRQVARRLRRPYREVQMLVDGGFLYDFDGIVVVRHWLVANTLRADRMKEVQYPELAKQLYITRNKQYVLQPQGVCRNLLDWRTEKMSDICPPKIREEKIKEENITEENINQSNEAQEEQTQALDPDEEVTVCGVVRLTRGQIEYLQERMGNGKYELFVSRLADKIAQEGIYVRNHYVAILRMYLEDEEVL